MKAYEILRKVTLDYGTDICLNRNRCKSIITDFFQNSFIKEKNLIFTALEI